MSIQIPKKLEVRCPNCRKNALLVQQNLSLSKTKIAFSCPHCKTESYVTHSQIYAWADAYKSVLRTR
ncbi:MAG: hypothetical protein ACRCV3_05970 [Desulfovibrionaceae bacterium]